MGSFSFRKHTARVLIKLIFKYIFHLLSIGNINQFYFAWQMGISFLEQSVKFNGFQAFLRKKVGKDLIHDVTMLLNKE
jgi:hypothetical protein